MKHTNQCLTTCCENINIRKDVLEDKPRSAVIGSAFHIEKDPCEEVDQQYLYFLSFSHSNRFLRATGGSGRSFLQSYIHP